MSFYQQLEQDLKGLRVRAPKHAAHATHPAVRASTPAAKARDAHALEAINYRVPGIVAPIRQPSSMVCWATVTTMMVSWRNQQSMTIETAIGGIGATWLAKYQANQGLSASEKPVVLTAAGLNDEPPASYPPEQWAAMSASSRVQARSAAAALGKS